jgi:hypothetical protein
VRCRCHCRCRCRCRCRCVTYVARGSEELSGRHSIESRDSASEHAATGLGTALQPVLVFLPLIRVAGAAVWSLVPSTEPPPFDTSSSSHSGTGAVVAEGDVGMI